MHTAVSWALGMDLTHFTQFANASIKSATLGPGCTAWIPYGWAPILINRAGGSVAMSLHVPYVSTILARRYPLLGLWCRYQLDSVPHQKSMEKHAGPFQEWLESLLIPSSAQSSTGTTSVAVEAPNILAISDVAAEKQAALQPAPAATVPDEAGTEDNRANAAEETQLQDDAN